VSFISKKQLSIVITFLIFSFLYTFLLFGENIPCSDIYNVKEFGAKGDGNTDDTEIIQKALNIAGEKNGGIVFLPIGSYLIKGNLIVPENVTLEGIWRAPFRGEPTKAGSVLLAISGKGEADGAPFIRVNTSSTLKGFAVFYPEQTKTDPPIPYPWTIQCNGAADDVSLIDLTLINPYKAIDFGTFPAGRHKIKNIHAYPLYRGLYINQCYDVGRIEDIHFWPFWDLNPNSPLWKFTQREGIAFIIGKTDGEMGYNLFSIFYSIGMQFIAGPIYDENRNITKNLPGSGTYTHCYMDITPCAVKVDSAMENAGITFLNSSFMAKAVISPSNRGPVKFVGCGFWGTKNSDYQVFTEGQGSVTLNACHFSGWDRVSKGFPCINANNRYLIVSNCEFIGTSIERPIIHLGHRVRSGIITSNISHGNFEITNNALKSAQIVIKDNLETPKTNFVLDWTLLGPFPNSIIDKASDIEISREGLKKDFLEVLGGEEKIGILSNKDINKLKEIYNDVKIVPFNSSKTKSIKVQLHEIFGLETGIVYALTYIYSKEKQNALFELGMNDGGKVFLNGKEVYSRFSKDGTPCEPGTDSFTSELNKGYNTLLLKIENLGGKWEFMLEIYPDIEEDISITTQVKTNKYKHKNI